MPLLKDFGPHYPKEIIRNALDNVPAMPGSEPFNAVATELIVNQLLEYGYLDERAVRSG